MEIRKLKAAEADFLKEMLYEAIFIPEGHEPLPKSILEDESLSKYFINWGKDVYDIALVAETENNLIGAIWGRLFDEENQGFGFVDAQTPELSMAIKPNFRSKGIGTKLMEAIAVLYKNIGVKQLSLSVDKVNRASELYTRLGCQITGETETSWTMVKSLR